MAVLHACQRHGRPPSPCLALLQFLPQDKVASFAAMNSTELLEATQQALGDARLWRVHQDLIKLRSDEKQAQLVRARCGLLGVPRWAWMVRFQTRTHARIHTCTHARTHTHRE